MRRAARLAWAWFATCALAGCATLGDPAGAVVDAYLDAFNAGDVDRAMSLVDPAVEMVTPAQGRSRGAEPLRQVLEFDARIGVRLRPTSRRLEGDTIVFGVLVETNEFHGRLGAAEVRYAAGTRMRVSHGRIVEIHPQPFDAATQSTLDAGMAEFLSWLRATEPEAEARLFPDAGRRVYSAASAELWLSYLRRWPGSRRPVR